jgi:copper chaperone CopZ
MIAFSLRRLVIGLVLSTGASLVAPGWAASASQVEVTVNGMVCSFCAQGIERNLRRLSSTQGVVVDLKAHRVTISLKPGATPNEQQIRKAIRDSGFDVREIHYVKPGP